MITLAILLGLPSPPDSTTPSAPERWAPTVPLLQVRTAPDTGAALRGQLVRGEAFDVLGHEAGPGCDDWGRLAAAGWACLDLAEPSPAEPVPLPRPFTYAPPYPEQRDGYLETGTWTHGPAETLLPFAYAERTRRWRGEVWGGVDHWLHGDPPIARLPYGRPSRFTAVVSTEKGPVLIRPDGTAVPEEQVYVFPVSRLQGRDLVARPLPEGLTVAWVIAARGAEVRDAAAGSTVATAAYHAELDVRPGPAGWWEAPAGLGNASGWLRAADLRVWAPAERPEGVADAELWVDVDLGQNVIALVRGDTAEYVTLTSPGVGTHRTPTGTFRVLQKVAWGDMASSAGASDPYHVEAVPWTVTFKPRYAIHGAYWHQAFGTKVSHGCVNLAPRDAAVVFARVKPALPPGWLRVQATEDDPGTVVRVR